MLAECSFVAKQTKCNIFHDLLIVEWQMSYISYVVTNVFHIHVQCLNIPSLDDFVFFQQSVSLY